VTDVLGKGYNQAVWQKLLRPPNMTNVTQVLSEIEQGDPAATERLLPLIYVELRKLASAKLANEKPGQTLQATALVHEAYLRLVGTEPARAWNSRGHFFAAAAEAMRRILVDTARRKQSIKGGGEYLRVELDDCLVATGRPIDLIALDEAMDKLAKQDARKAELVMLRFFGGLSIREAAMALDISESTADADWRFAKAWLKLQMTK
jgi:RNA polymerase sigma factor (TIGR02999 family)